MKITERALLDNYSGKSVMGLNLSEIGENTFSWSYSRGRGDEFCSVLSREKAYEIVVYLSTSAFFVPLDEDCKEHPAASKQEADADN